MTKKEDLEKLVSEIRKKEKHIYTNVASVYFTTVAFLPLLQAGEDSGPEHFSANIIVISSMSGIMSHDQGHFAYNAAKGSC